MLTRHRVEIKEGWVRGLLRQLMYACGVVERRVALVAMLVVLGLLLRGSLAQAKMTLGSPLDTYVTNGSVDAIAQGNGVFYLGGSFTEVGPRTGPGVAIGSGSGLNLGWAEVSAGSVAAVAPDGAGGFYIGGSFNRVGGVSVENLAHILSDGSVDQAFTPNPDGEVDAIAVSGSTIYIGGAFQNVGSQSRAGLAAVSMSGGAVTGWNPGVSGGSVGALATNGSTIYVGGDFNSLGGQTRDELGAVDTSGNVLAWNPITSSNSGDTVSALAVDPSGTVFVGGSFQSIGGQTRYDIAALDPSTGAATAWNAQIGDNDGDGDGNGGGSGDGDGDDSANDAHIKSLAVSGSTLYVGGNFDSIGGQTRGNLAALDTTTGAATSWDPEVDGPVSSVAVAGSVVDIGGAFHTVEGVTRNNLAAIDAGTGQATSWNPDANGTVNAIGADGSTVYAGGDLSSINGVPRNNVAALDSTSGAVTSWNPGADGRVDALALSGSTVYAGGEFQNIGGQPRPYLAGLDASSGAATAFTPSPDASVQALALSGSTLYVGGNFSSLAGQTRHAAGAIDTTSGDATQWDPEVDMDSSGDPGSVDALAVSGSVVYLGGDFQVVGGQVRTDIAAVDATSGAATSWNPSADNSVLALAVEGSTVYAGGRFANIGGQARTELAALDATSGQATSWDAHIDDDLNISEVDSLAVDASDVYVGGDYGLIGGKPRGGLAAVDASTGHATSWNPEPFGSVDALTLSGLTLYAGGDFTGMADVAQQGDAVFQGTQVIEHSVAVSVAGPGNGSVAIISPAGDSGIPVVTTCSSACSSTFDSGTQITLVPQTPSGSVFDGWSGACSGQGPCSLTLSADQSATATFSLAPTGGTTGSPGPAVGSPSPSTQKPLPLNKRLSLAVPNRAYLIAVCHAVRSRSERAHCLREVNHQPHDRTGAMQTPSDTFAAGIAHAGSPSATYTTLLNFLASGSIGVYADNGAPIISGAEHSVNDFYLYDFEVQGAADGLYRGQTETAAQFAAQLTRLGIAIKALAGNHTPPSPGNGKVDPQSLVDLLRAWITAARSDPTSPHAQIPLAIAALAAHHHPAIDLTAAQPASKVTFDPMQELLITTGIFGPIERIHTATRSPQGHAVDATAVRAAGSPCDPKELGGPKSLSDVVQDYLGDQVTDKGAEVAKELGKEWAKAGITKLFGEAVAETAEKSIGAGVELVAKLPAALAAWEVYKNLEVDRGDGGASALSTRYGPARKGVAQAGRSIDFSARVVMTADLGGPIGCLQLSGVKIPPPGPVANIPVIWYVDAGQDQDHKAILTWHGTFNPAVPSRGPLSGYAKILTKPNGNADDATSVLTFTPRNEAVPGLGHLIYVSGKATGTPLWGSATENIFGMIGQFASPNLLVVIPWEVGYLDQSGNFVFDSTIQDNALSPAAGSETYEAKATITLPPADPAATPADTPLEPNLTNAHAPLQERQAHGNISVSGQLGCPEPGGFELYNNFSWSEQIDPGKAGALQLLSLKSKDGTIPGLTGLVKLDAPDESVTSTITENPNGLQCQLPMKPVGGYWGTYFGNNHAGELAPDSTNSACQRDCYTFSSWQPDNTGGVSKPYNLSGTDVPDQSCQSGTRLLGTPDNGTFGTTPCAIATTYTEQTTVEVSPWRDN